MGIRNFAWQVTHGLSPYHLSLLGKCLLLVYEALDCRSRGGEVLAGGMKIRDVVARQVVEGVAVAGSAVDAGECDGKVLLQKRFGPQLHLAERIRERRDVLADFEFDACDARLQVGGDARDVSLFVLAAFALDAGRIGADGAGWRSKADDSGKLRSG